MNRWIFLRTLLVVAAHVSSLVHAGICDDGKEADGINRAGDNGVCMAMQTLPYTKKDPKAPLLIVIHGDNGGKMFGTSYPTLASKLSEEFSSPAVFMLRPGYKADFGQSDGTARFQDDDYTSENLKYMYFALAHLRQIYPDRRFILVGHSGGAAVAALLISQYPKLADAVVLAACPCDVQPWRKWRKESGVRSDGYWPHSLSPSDFSKAVLTRSVVVAVTGDKDTNTLPKFAEEYISALRANGVENAKFILAAGASHGSVRQSSEFLEGIRFALDKVAALD